MSAVEKDRRAQLVVVPTPGTEPAEFEYVEFFRAGALVRGWFSCADCEWVVRSLHQLPECPSCGGRLWEPTWLPASRHDDAAAWEHELDDGARFVQGVALAVVLGSLCWAAIVGLGLAVFFLARG